VAAEPTLPPTPAKAKDDDEKLRDYHKHSMRASTISVKFAPTMFVVVRQTRKKHGNAHSTAVATDRCSSLVVSLSASPVFSKFSQCAIFITIVSLCEPGPTSPRPESRPHSIGPVTLSFGKDVTEFGAYANTLAPLLFVLACMAWVLKYTEHPYLLHLYVRPLPHTATLPYIDVSFITSGWARCWADTLRKRLETLIDKARNDLIKQGENEKKEEQEKAQKQEKEQRQGNRSCWKCWNKLGKHNRVKVTALGAHPKRKTDAQAIAPSPSSPGSLPSPISRAGQGELSLDPVYFKLTPEADPDVAANRKERDAMYLDAANFKDHHFQCHQLLWNSTPLLCWLLSLLLFSMLRGRTTCTGGTLHGTTTLSSVRVAYGVICSHVRCCLIIDPYCCISCIC
jgi:hypothetical protein